MAQVAAAAAADCAQLQLNRIIRSSESKAKQRRREPAVRELLEKTQVPHRLQIRPEKSL